MRRRKYPADPALRPDPPSQYDRARRASRVRGRADALKLPAVLTAYESTYDTIIHQGLTESPWRVRPQKDSARGLIKPAETQNLLECSNIHHDAVLLIMRDFRVSFTNNPRERKVRMAKVRQKIARTFRSVHGADAISGIRSDISTAKSKGCGSLNGFKNALHGKGFILKAIP